jgi:hypothetical protein
VLEHDWSVEEVDDATLVEVVVRNPTAVARRVRVVNRLDGPALPPRREGVPEPGWSDDGYEGTVPPNDRLTLGYACAAAADDPPVDVIDAGHTSGEDGEGEGTTPDAADAVRLLGDHAPPADALPDAGDGTNGGGSVESVASDGASTGAPTDRPAPATDAPPTPVVDMLDCIDDGDGRAAAGRPASDGETSPVRPSTDETRDGVADPEARNGASGPAGSAGTPHSGNGPANAGGPRSDVDRGEGGRSNVGDGPTDADLPDDVASWIATVEGRVEHGERLTGASVVEAAAVVDDRGGVGAVASLSDRLAADERALRALAERVDELADRAAAADVPVEALRRLS